MMIVLPLWVREKIERMRGTLKNKMVVLFLDSGFAL